MLTRLNVAIGIVLRLQKFRKLGEFVFRALSLLSLGRLLAFIQCRVVDEIEVGWQVPQQAALPQQRPKQHYPLRHTNPLSPQSSLWV